LSGYIFNKIKQEFPSHGSVVLEVATAATRMYEREKKFVMEEIIWQMMFKYYVTQ
jgi:hypothetical protein